MRVAGILLGCLLLLPNAAAEAAAVTAKCDLDLDVTDTDPKGLNVRAEPSASARVIGVLKPEGDWVELHVTAQSGDWFAIDKATVMDTTAPTDKVVFHGLGFVHRSKVGGSEMMAQAVLRDRPDDKARIILDVTGQDEVPVTVLGCSGDYYKVKVHKTIGWSTNVCLNQLTTCS